MNRKIVSMIVAAAYVGLGACSSNSDLSSYPPYNAYTGKTVPLVSAMPVEYDFKKQKPSKIVSAGTPITIQRVFLEKTMVRGPIIPAPGVSTQIFAAIEYLDPVTKALKIWNYPLGSKSSPYGYAEHIISAPWEPASTPPLRYVGKEGKSFKEG